MALQALLSTMAEVTAKVAEKASEAASISIRGMESVSSSLLSRFSQGAQDLLLRTGSVRPDAVLDTLRPGISTAEPPKMTTVETSFPGVSPESRPLSLNLRPDEAKIYHDAGLRTDSVNNRDHLLRNDIDWSLKDGLGTTNLERKQMGLAPIDAKTGLRIELHHVGQEPNGPLAELTELEHRRPPNNLILHPLRTESPVDHGSAWNSTVRAYWKARPVAV